MAHDVGILAYGSLIDDPGAELAPHIIARIDAVTPFKVEFARTSRGRDGAPTLVPYPDGATVKAVILALDLPVSEAKNRLYRREANNVDGTAVYAAPPAGRKNSIRIPALADVGGVSTVLYTEISANIDALSPLELARLAIKSARARSDGRDGISYLRDALANGIETPLSSAYRQKILELLSAKDLTEAVATAWESRPKEAGVPPGLDEIESRLGIADDYLLAARILAAQSGIGTDIRLLLPSGQLIAHATEMLLKSMLADEGHFVPAIHDLVELRHLLVGEGKTLSVGLEFVVKFLGPLHAGHVFRYGSADHGIPTAQQMIARLEPELAAFRKVRRG